MAKPGKKAAKAATPAAPLPAALEATGEQRGAALAQVTERMGGAHPWYGEPVQQGDRTIIPVARVRGVGGFGWGSGWGSRDGESGGNGGGESGGGGARVRAVPVGFIEVGPEGSSFTPIIDPFTRVTTVALSAAAAVSVAGAVTVSVAGALAGLRLARAGRRGRSLLRR